MVLGAEWDPHVLHVLVSLVLLVTLEVMEGKLLTGQPA